MVQYVYNNAMVFSGCTWSSVINSAIDEKTNIQNWLDTFKLTLNVTTMNFIAFLHTGLPSNTFM